MKKVHSFRLLAIAIFCMASISIKSETTACKLICQYTAQSGAAASVKLLQAETDNDSYRPDIFYIKI
ncbi:MAG: hypothetical protein M3015_17150 [Bacteroidota bacterium]|nr:hypothetical protein [Bacteroidota bacterium]